MFLPQSLSKVISSPIEKRYGGVGIPNFDNSNCSRKHTIKNAVQAVQTVPLLTNMHNVLNVLDVSPISMKRAQNRQEHIDVNIENLEIEKNIMISVLRVPHFK